MSINQITGSQRNNGIDLRFKKLHPVGNVLFLSQPQIAGRLVGIINGVSGEVGLIPITAPQATHYSSYFQELNIPALTTTTVSDYGIQSSPISDLFVRNNPSKLEVKESGSYLFIVHANIGANINDVTISLAINSVDVTTSYFLPSVAETIGTYMHFVHQIVADDFVEVKFNNTSIQPVSMVNFGVLTIIKINN